MGESGNLLKNAGMIKCCPSVKGEKTFSWKIVSDIGFFLKRKGNKLAVNNLVMVKIH